MLDAWLIRFNLGPAVPMHLALYRLLSFIERREGQIDWDGVPAAVVQSTIGAPALASAFSLWSLLDRSYPYRGYAPLAGHLCGAADGNGVEPFANRRQRGLPLVSLGPLRFALGARRRPDVIEWALPHVVLAREADGPRDVAIAVLDAMSAMGCKEAVGSTAQALAIGSPDRPAFMASVRVASGYEELARSGSLVAARRVPRPRKSEAARSAAAAPAEPVPPFTPVWQSAVARFHGEAGGLPNATRHFNKHVLLGREWPSAEMPAVAAYVASAQEVANGGEYELYQPANDAVIKYDATRNSLVIARRSTGALLTYFRPDSSSYILRKLRDGVWVAPPIGGVVRYERPPDPEHAGIMERLDAWDGLANEGESLVAALAAAPTGPGWTLISALAACTSMERERCEILGLYVTDELRPMVEARLLRAQDALGGIEAVLEAKGPLALLRDSFSAASDRLAILARGCSGREEEAVAEFAAAVCEFSDAVAAIGPGTPFERHARPERWQALRVEAVAWRALLQTVRWAHQDGTEVRDVHLADLNEDD